MHIRRATIEDSTAIAPLLLSAMEDIIFDFIGKENYNSAIDFLTIMVAKSSNQYSYENCWVVENDMKKIVAAANVYDGANLSSLRVPVAQEIATRFSKYFQPENETNAGEIYIDSIGVSLQQQGKGVGSKLLQHLIMEYVHHQKQTLGLLVELDKSQAKQLYLKLGFELVGKKTLAGKQLEHFQYKFPFE